MDTDRASSSAAEGAWQRVARITLAALLLAAGLWILSDFLPALAWAAVLTIALGPLYRRLMTVLPAQGGRILAPLLATIAVGVVLLGPLVLLGIALAREAHVAIGLASELRHHGLAPPDWVGQLPYVGPTLLEWWQANLSDPAVVDALIGRIDLRSLSEPTRLVGAQLVHRLVLLLFTLLTLFFLFRDGSLLAAQLRGLGDRVIGQQGERIAGHMIAAVHGTVTGLVLVGLAEGALLALVYVAVGLPHPVSIGALTGVAAVIPFAAPVVYCLAGLYLFAVGNTVAAAVVVIAGSVVVFVADHFVRPFLIGGTARLPFLLVLFGLLGGLQTLGFLGLFLGPAVMAALVALWREWTETGPAREPARPISARPGGPARSPRRRRG